jgi:hypothetical protein
MNRFASWSERGRGIARQLRLGMTVPAALSMVELIGELAQGRGQLPAALEAGFADLVGRLLARQEAHDWLGLADYLEYELAAWLAQVEAAA